MSKIRHPEKINKPINPIKNTIGIIITKDEIDEALSRFKKALDRITDELVREGTWKP